MLSFKAYLTEKKSKVLINPKKDDLKEVKKEHGEDCDCMKCEKDRRKNDVNDGPDDRMRQHHSQVLLKQVLLLLREQKLLQK